jgi:LPXTG-motif cell wall-anchored protein
MPRRHFPDLKEAVMNQPRPIGPSAAAGGAAAAGGLPVTGSNTLTIILVGLMLLGAGLLLLRRSRYQRSEG